MSLFLLAFLIGLVAGLRSMVAPAAVSWAAHLGWLRLGGTPLAFLGATITPYVFSVLAAGELVSDKLPRTPSRKVPIQFIGRVGSGALCGAAIGASSDALLPGLVVGAIGAIAGTLGGAAARGHLAARFGKDLPAALIEDAVAIVVALVVVTRFM
jgi:uncharacterized membrane protein